MKHLRFFVILVVTACTTGHRYTIEKEPQKYEVEVDTIDELALQAVDETKTDFFVPLQDDMGAWDRTKIFFVKYLNIPNLKDVLQKNAKSVVLTNSLEKGTDYHYIVRKELFGNGYNYFVNCKPAVNGASQIQASRNAKNLSRFILDGTLETTLLK